MSRHPAVKHINTVFQDSFKNWRPPRSIGLRLVGDCMRRTILDINAQMEGPGDPPDMGGMMNMSYGSAFEIWIIERFQQAKVLKYGGVQGKDMQVNVRVPQYGGNGYMDCLLHYEGSDYGGEVKSVGARAFDDIVNKRKPRKKDYYQLQIYLHFEKLEKGWLIYIDREKYFENINGNQVPRWEIIEVDYDPVLGKKLEKRLKKLHEHRQNKTIPEKEPKDPGDERCTWCPHRKYCWGSLADSGRAGGNARAQRIAQNSKARRRKRASSSGTESS